MDVTPTFVVARAPGGDSIVNVAHITRVTRIGNGSGVVLYGGGNVETQIWVDTSRTFEGWSEMLGVKPAGAVRD